MGNVNVSLAPSFPSFLPRSELKITLQSLWLWANQTPVSVKPLAVKRTPIEAMVLRLMAVGNQPKN
ncbi:hypothetical protein GS601_00555 [Myxacorys almedinensis A]|uniref:Uncharacterized protein n=1 Tax=Myxacorys almedinensis A TaxID=2690445 RepID=A0A8J7Z114_9CYAN|nr:hypothetical protein [Myxacorys almedinensis]NDJ15791.1 hypothetical protein [Myxacorys almedinensis A]